MLLLQQSSENTQLRVIYRGQMPLVTVVETEVILVQQFVRIVGVPKFHAEPH
jgi:hypothetical protein